MKSDPALPSDGMWRDCTPGELVQLGAEQQRRAGRRAFLRGLSLATAGCAAGGAVGLVLWYQQRGPRPEKPFAPGGLICDEVRRLLPAYVANQLDPQRANQVRAHLAACSHCSAALKALQSQARLSTINGRLALLVM